MIKTKKIKAGIIGACIIASTFSMPYADNDNARLYTDPEKGTVVEAELFMSENDIPVSSNDMDLVTTQIIKVNDSILQKQQEIDKFLFEQNNGIIAEKGFSITHTVPLEKHVEIGITPYNEENADYLYEIFGEDLINVVEGQQAYTMELATASSEAPKAVKSSKIASFFINIFEWIKSLFS